MRPPFDFVVDWMSRRTTRLAHLYWHASREIWTSLSQRQIQDLTSLIPSGWIPNPSLDSRGNVLSGDEAGLDFLYMHRHMIEQANQIMKDNGGERLRGWPTPPLPGDDCYPVPHDYRLPPEYFPAKDDRVWCGVLADTAKVLCPDVLQKIKLGALGTYLEYGIHAAMHVRFGGYAGPGLRVNVEPINPIWDDPSYNSLLDAYSAHVHSWFWKIHGWVDDRIGDWEKANGMRADFSSAWMGPMHRHHHHHHHSGTDSKLEETLERAVVFLIRAGADGMFRARPVSLSDLTL